MCRMFQEYSRNYFINQLLLIGRIFNGIFLHMQLFVMFLFLLWRNILGIFCRLDRARTRRVFQEYSVENRIESKQAIRKKEDSTKCYRKNWNIPGIFCIVDPPLGFQPNTREYSRNILA